MRVRMTTWFLSGALCASLALHAAPWWSATSLASPPAPAPSAAALELTPEQVERLVQCRDACCETQQSLQQEVAEVETELRAALAAERPDLERARALATRLGDLRARCLQNGVETILRVREVLTPEQIEKLVTCFESGCTVATRE